jgi:arylsulfatase A-like enzyme
MMIRLLSTIGFSGPLATRAAASPAGGKRGLLLGAIATMALPAAAMPVSVPILCDDPGQGPALVAKPLPEFAPEGRGTPGPVETNDAEGKLQAPGPRQRPNLILVMADDQGYGDCGFTGHPFVQTPNLDEMARHGIVFNRFYAAAPVCSPTRASVLTGRHPFRANVPDHGHYLRPGEVTLAEALKSAGYATAHFGKWHIGSVQPDTPTNPGGAGFDEWLSALNFFDRDPYLSRNGRYEHRQGQGTVITMDETIGYLERNHGNAKPMFVVTWFPAPHDPHRELPRDMDAAGKLYQDRDPAHAGYYREITLVDQQVGRLRECLRRLGIERDTLVFYCSDNGGIVREFSGGRAKKASIYEGGLRVPAILEWPSRLTAATVDVPAFTSDLYPTLLAVAGAKVENQPPLDGIDLSAVIAGTRNRRPPMGFWYGHTPGQSTPSDKIIKELMEAQRTGKPDPHPERLLKNVREFPSFGGDARRGHAAWIDWPWKLHRIQPRGAAEPKLELYHLADDPLEAADLAAKEPRRATAMRAALEAWQRSVLESWAGKDYRERGP